MDDQEKVVLDLLAQVWNEYTELDEQTNNENNEFMQGIHMLQCIILARATLRTMVEEEK